MRRIYDFDGTIYDGDSTARFCLFCVKRRPGLFLRLPRVAVSFLLMRAGRRSKTKAKEVMYRTLLAGTRDLEGQLSAFWAAELPRIKGWYMAQKAPDDLIISASPEFLLEPVCEKLGVHLIASRVDRRTGLYDGLNCDGEEKVRRYRAQCAQAPFEFYSDALIDAPMARLAKRAWLVTGDRLDPWPK